MRFASSSRGVLFHCEVTRSSSSKFYFETIHISYTTALAKKDGKKIHLQKCIYRRTASP